MPSTLFPSPVQCVAGRRDGPLAEYQWVVPLESYRREIDLLTPWQYLSCSAWLWWPLAVGLVVFHWSPTGNAGTLIFMSLVADDVLLPFQVSAYPRVGACAGQAQIVKKPSTTRDMGRSRWGFLWATMFADSWWILLPKSGSRPDLRKVSTGQLHLNYTMCRIYRDIFKIYRSLCDKYKYNTLQIRYGLRTSDTIWIK